MFTFFDTIHRFALDHFQLSFDMNCHKIIKTMAGTSGWVALLSKVFVPASDV